MRAGSIKCVLGKHTESELNAPNKSKVFHCAPQTENDNKKEWKKEKKAHIKNE